jgi:hypothetical protein
MTVDWLMSALVASAPVLTVGYLLVVFCGWIYDAGARAERARAQKVEDDAYFARLDREARYGK